MKVWRKEGARPNKRKETRMTPKGVGGTGILVGAFSGSEIRYSSRGARHGVPSIVLPSEGMGVHLGDFSPF